ncbi:TetR/AcrR family transcriptional regulator [Streptomyces sp. NPDC020792]|uniref:TetR/AcrR family transcriptional regulator n=1 Tax=Streptomyces sp. NPDC020792 TaxID=3365089 RepID=UPI00379A72FB
MESTTRRTQGVQTGQRSRQVISRVRDATLAELERVGFTAMTIEAVARRAGVNRTTIYRRWPSKAALLAAIAEPLARRYVDLPRTGDTREELTAAMMAIRDAWASPEGQALQAAVGAAKFELQDLVGDLVEQSMAPLLRVLGEASRRGDLPESDVLMVAHLAFQGVTTWQYPGGGPVSDDACRHMARLLLADRP